VFFREFRNESTLYFCSSSIFLINNNICWGNIKICTPIPQIYSNVNTEHIKKHHLYGAGTSCPCSKHGICFETTDLMLVHKNNNFTKIKTHSCSSKPILMELQTNTLFPLTTMCVAKQIIDPVPGCS